MDPRPLRLPFDPLDLPREWSIPIGRAVFGSAFFSCFVAFLVFGWIKIAGLLIETLLNQDGTGKPVFDLLAGVILVPQAIAPFAEFTAALLARLFGRPSYVCLTDNAFWHPQLARPIRLSDVRQLVIRRGFRTPDFSVTLHTIQPVRIRFMSLFNVSALMKCRDSHFRFTFLPSPWSNQGTLTQALIAMVQARGGEIVRR